MGLTKTKDALGMAEEKHKATQLELQRTQMDLLAKTSEYEEVGCGGCAVRVLLLRPSGFGVAYRVHVQGYRITMQITAPISTRFTMCCCYCRLCVWCRRVHWP